MDKAVKKELIRLCLTIFVVIGSLVAIVFFLTKDALQRSQSAAYSVIPSKPLDAGIPHSRQR
jgi:hypothetical protein